MSDPVLCVKIAEKMSAIHSMHVPLSKEPDWLWKTMNKWITTVENNIDKYQLKENHESSIVQQLKQIKIRSEIEWLKQFVRSCKSPVVFSHNDMQEGNILLRQTNRCDTNIEEAMPENNCDVDRNFVEDDGIACDFSQQVALKDKTSLFNVAGASSMDCLESSSDSVLSISSKKSSINNNEPELVLIDFEYCSYNYRGFDLANHFIEWTYDYSNEEHPYFYDRPQDYPIQEQQVC